MGFGAPFVCYMFLSQTEQEKKSLRFVDKDQANRVPRGLGKGRENLA